MSWTRKLLITYENFTTDLPDLQDGNKTEGCFPACDCKCKCCRGHREKYVAFNGENESFSEFPNEFSGEAEDVQKMIRFRSSDILLLLQAAQLRDNFWTNQYFKADLQEDYEAVSQVFKVTKRQVQLEMVVAILDTVSTGYRRAVSQLTGEEAQGALRPKMAAITLPGLRCICQKCEQLPWKKLQDVEDHQESHTYSDNFHCEICYRRFYLQHSLTTHLSRKIGGQNDGSEELRENGRYKRFLDNQKIREQEELEKRPAKVKEIVVPVYNDQELYLKEESRYPLKKRQSSSRTQCPICHQKYGYSFSHQLHMVKHRRDKFETPKLFPCSFCQRSFLTHKFMRKHQKRVILAGKLRYRPFKCPSCQWRFQLWSALKIHVIRKHERKKLCLICKNPTLDRCCSAHTPKECREAIKKHREMRRLKGAPVCEICGKDFANKFFLREHLNKTHLNRRNFTCEICGANFYSQGTMQTHRKSVHFLMQTMKCEVCNLIVKSRANYQRHCKSQRHIDEIIKLELGNGNSKETFSKESVAINQPESNHRITQTTEELINMESYNEATSINAEKATKKENNKVVTQKKEKIKSKTPRGFQKPDKLTFCEPCGNSIVGNMQRHYKSTKHKRNLIAHNRNMQILKITNNKNL
ncbi:zinc finger protein 555 [Drosophila elegans]|uniref:zinc finger protein 555 n=1 Tax=Drosophila elegans TaxID=30023 RepID=UPI0007E71BF4|nr:zinc finger protein 555 [Drosophila elegans]